MSPPGGTGDGPMHVVISARAVRSGAGSSRIVLALTRGLAERGHRVEVVADRLAAGEIHAAGGVARYPLASAGLQSIARRMLGRGTQLALRDRAVRRRRADLVISDGDLGRQDVVLVHNIVGREVEALGAAANQDHRRAAAAQERALRSHSYRLVVANSRLTAHEFSRRFGCPPERMAVVYPGYDPLQFSSSQRGSQRHASRQALGIGADVPVVAFISSGHFILRGVDVLAGSLARLAPGLRRRVRLLGIGSETNTGLLRDALAKAGMEQALISRPRTDQVERYYHAADVLFHPAHFETFGLVVIEAAACGTPVLTSRSVGAAELFGGEGAAAVVDNSDAGLFAPLLERLLAEPEQARVVADSQHQAVRGNTWDAYGAGFMAALQRHGLAGPASLRDPAPCQTPSDDGIECDQAVPKL